jgi:heat shock protein HslJ
MSSYKLRSIFLSGLLVVIVACSPAEQNGESNDVTEQAIPLEGSNWQLVQLTVLGGYVFVPEESSEYVLNFRSENRLSGISDCNTISGSWQQENNGLHFEPFSSSRSLCAPGSLHNNLVLYLKDVAAHSLRDGHLVLTTPTEGIEIEFASRD